MITSNSIENIRQAQLSDVVGHYIKLKHQGANYSACCPFHNEKSSSFIVSDVKDMYKCFGCGRSGDAINFVMEHENKTFVEACLEIAKICGIEVEMEEKEYTEKEKQALSAAEKQEQVLNIVVPMYQEQLHKLSWDHPVKRWLTDRGVGTETMLDWQIGWSPDDWRFITPVLIEKGLFEPAEKLGIIRRGKTDNNYDGYRSRIIFPISDRNGRFIGLGGRYIRLNENDGKDIAKYVNPPECEIYNKSTVFYGLKQAAKAIKEEGEAMVVEGYMDVISPHRAGWKNVIGTCGTAFTDQQVKLVKKYTNRVVLWRDNDTAGIKATVSHIPTLLKQSITVQLIQYAKKDPDEFIQSLDSYNGNGTWEWAEKIDAVIWYARHIWKNVSEIHEQASAKAAILQLLTNVTNEILRNNYLDNLSQIFKWKANDTKREFKSLIDNVSILEYDEEEEDNNGIKFAEWVSDEQKEEVMRSGYLSVNRKEKGKPMVGYYTFSSGGKTELTNFIITPLFRVEAGQESRYLSEINNGYVKGVVDMPAKVFPSIEQFQGMCISAAGAFIIYAVKNQWLRIATDLLHKYPSCIEVNELGWQKRGNFFVYVDKVYIPGKDPMNLDEWGIVKKDEVNYLVPAGSAAYKKLQQFGKDPYENLRFLTWKESPVNFSTWSKQMHRVYGQKGIVAVAYAILTIFKDVVFDVDNNCPHLYAFGEPSSGKSKWAESITAIFFFRRSAYNLNSGTDFAFFSFLSQFTNCPAHLNEFDIEVIKMEWFQAIKGAFDGEGRERGKIGAKNATEIQRVVSTVILTGQKLVTADDNSVVTRSIIESFSTNDDRTEDDKKAYDTLKDWERVGMNSMLLEVLLHRDKFEKQYKETFNNQLSAWRKTKSETANLNQRIVQNFAHLATCYTMISEYISLPQDVDQFKDYCFSQAGKWSGFIRSSDTLSEFWRTLEFLYNQNDVLENWDYVVEESLDVSVRINREESKKHSFDKPTMVLYLRLNNIHKLFQTAYRNRTGKEAMSIENLLHYFTSRKYYIGPVKQKRFKRFKKVTDNVPKTGGLSPTTQIETFNVEEEKITSCYAFVYSELEIDIAMDNKASEFPF